MEKQEFKILTVNKKSEEKFLRRKTVDFDFSKFKRSEINELVQNMRKIMIVADGVGLAANQVGFDFRVFVAQIRATKRRSADSVASEDQKFYAIFNPEIIKKSSEKSIIDEGCLSVPGGYFGDVERPAKIMLVGQDKSGKKIKIKAWGLLARVFQHEVDHLNGILFIDKAKKVKKIEIEDKI